jgi:hypothetical protein
MPGLFDRKGIGLVFCHETVLSATLKTEAELEKVERVNERKKI